MKSRFAQQKSLCDQNYLGTSNWNRTVTYKLVVDQQSSLDLRELGLQAYSDLAKNSPAHVMTAWPEYMLDSLQRGALFVDLLRQRGNQQIEITSRPTATVLHFKHEVLMSGSLLAKPINYTLSRIFPPPGVETDPSSRPVVVVDPRAGQSSGIGGFKPESEIGYALSGGHPVYFIGFSAIPEPKQQFLDVVEGQVEFFEHVVALHPKAPKPFVIGNCQAGYQTLMVAMLRPDLFGPILVPGTPMSYWQGEHGKNPMRYSGGLLGGSWLNAMASDMGKGKIDGTSLIMNFENLNPAYSLWGKYYEIFTSIDTDADRFLKFERWWGDFIEFNGCELQYVVDNLFIGDKLTRNELHSTDGEIFDLRKVTSPIIVFTSTEDNISPPPQSLGWILDLYQSVDEIYAADRTIVYCLSHDVGHLAIFVSSMVGAKQYKEFFQLMDVIDCLPPGLHEMVISKRPVGLPSGGYATDDWFARFEGRTLDDIRAVGRNTPEDNLAFAAAAKLSEWNLSLYRMMLQPLVRAMATQPMADLTRALNPLRLSYTFFANNNPWSGYVQELAASVVTTRRPAFPNNPFIAMQDLASAQVIVGLDGYRASRDYYIEKFFFGFYGSTFLQKLFGITAKDDEEVLTSVTSEKVSTDLMRVGGFNEALTRAVLYINAADKSFDQRSAYALNVARQKLMKLPLTEFKALIRQQALMLRIDCECALDTLVYLVPTQNLRKKLFKQVKDIVVAGEPLSFSEERRLNKLSQVFNLR